MYINVVFWGYNHDNGLKWLSHVIIVRVQDKQLLTTKHPIIATICFIFYNKCNLFIIIFQNYSYHPII
jgi:hypothetical protein